MSAFTRVDDNGFVMHSCPGCGGSSHPATGCAYSETMVFCWSCTLDWARWVTKHTNKRGRGGRFNFYDHVSRPA
jgi:hypothetical protein